MLPKKLLLQKKTKTLKAATPAWDAWAKTRHMLYIEAVGPGSCPGLGNSGAVELPGLG